MFDVGIGAFDGAEVYKLVGNFLLHKLSEKYERKNLALYRDDGIALFKNVNRPGSEKIKKRFCKLFIDDLELTIQCNRKVVNILDNTLNFKKLNIPSLLSISHHKIQSSKHQAAAKISRIKIIPVIGKERNIKELSHTMQ